MIRQRLPAHVAQLREADPVDALVFSYGAARQRGDAADQATIREHLMSMARTMDNDALVDWMTDPFDILIEVASAELARRAPAPEAACSRP